MPYVPFNFLNFGVAIYYTTKSEGYNLIFLIYCAKCVSKWESHRIKLINLFKKSQSL